MVSLRDFARNMDERADKLEKTASDAAVRAAKAVLRRLTLVTPVDTAKAISNWQIGLGSPPQGVLEPYVFGQRRASGSAAYQIGVAELAKKIPGQSIFVSNLTPYIKELNQGSSKQAPAGFVEAAVLVGRQAIKRGYDD